MQWYGSHTTGPAITPSKRQSSTPSLKTLANPWSVKLFRFCHSLSAVFSVSTLRQKRFRCSSMAGLWVYFSLDPAYAARITWNVGDIVESRCVDYVEEHSVNLVDSTSCREPHLNSVDIPSALVQCTLAPSNSISTCHGPRFQRTLLRGSGSPASPI